MKKIFLPVLLTSLIWLLFALSIIGDFSILQDFWVRIVLLLVSTLSSFLLLALLIVNIKKQNQALKYTIIPEFRLEGLKFYELSMVLDGDLNMNDVLAILVHYSLFSPQEEDAVETMIMKNTSAHTISTLFRMHYLEMQTEEEREVSLFKDLQQRIKQPVVEHLRQKSYFNFNPQTVKMTGIVLMLLAIFPVALAQFAIFLGFALGIFLLGAHVFVYAQLFYENYHNILPVQARARGYEMYLKRVEWHTVKHDPEKFARFIPFFILYGLKQEKFEEMVEFTLARLQKYSPLS